jgi:hypothetical protein
METDEQDPQRQISRMSFVCNHDMLRALQALVRTFMDDLDKLDTVSKVASD